MMTDVLVIGAGPAGLTSGYYLQAAGISFEIVDRALVVGSTWAAQYPSLKLNTASFMSTLPEGRFPFSAGIVPTGKQYHEHLVAWLRTHPMPITLGVEVERVAPVGERWLVERSDGAREYSAVIIASGRWGNPYIPPIAGMDTFRGKVIHAHDFRDPAPFEGQRVLVVGAGPSGADIAVALAELTPGKIMLSIRSEIIISRRNPYGISEMLWKQLIERMPKAWRKPMTDHIIFMGFPDIEQYVRVAPNRDERQGSSVPVRGPELPRAFRSGTIKPVVGLKALHGDCVELDDGSQYEVDTVIMATGYRPVLNYLDLAFSTDAQGWPLREDEESTQLRGYPGLYLVGRYYRGFGAFYNMKVEAPIAVRLIQARLDAMTQA
jgi:putative flavoprotein involved in K+ transport